MSKRLNDTLLALQLLGNGAALNLKCANCHEVYFIRHAPTPVNLTGTMMQNYDTEGSIIPFDVEEWKSTVGKDINWKNIGEVWTSKALRTVQTARHLVGDDIKITTHNLLNEFDCSGLGDKKFWEISEEEFNELSGLDGSKCRKQIYELLDEISEWITENDKDLICITHGMFTRLLYTVLTNKGDHSMFDIINSKTFQFKNLDMLATECYSQRNAFELDKIYRNKDDFIKYCRG